MRTTRVAFAAAIAAGTVAFVPSAVGQDVATACTHGASSVGPVTIMDGHVSGDTAPYTEACLP
jgi:hypothetical protein